MLATAIQKYLAMFLKKKNPQNQTNNAQINLIKDIPLVFTVRKQ